MNHILTPPQSRAMTAIDAAIAAGQRRTTVCAERHCGLTTLFAEIARYQGMGSTATEFIIAEQGTASIKPDPNCETVVLVDRGVNFAPESYVGCTVITAESVFGVPAFELGAMTVDEVGKFLARHQFTMQGRRVTFTDTAVEHLHEETGGRIGILAPMMSRMLKTAKQLGDAKISSRLVTACADEPARKAA